ncbi:J domain-containing protein [Synechococcus sp. NB0720_010]|uniref:J domain-containing protein n=1 Tax=Synechococcus sp. NB0720_010 TaxID=2907159 RepID=UPI001FF9246F|nr:J domain-containing protein [Synechococcus sp. NB0720_010]UPH90646.1 J domain-containing protein [Synechococcus sp. NB0720_010]
MGFDPRRWSAEPRPQQRVTSNVDALLQENEALRSEVRQLRRQLEHLRQRPEPSRHHWRPPQALVSSAQVERWGAALAEQKGWAVLRQSGLEELIEQLNRSSFLPQLNLQQRLDHLVPGLGRDLYAATASPLNKKRCAVLAAFALYGVSAIEWLDDDPQRVVLEMRQRQRTSNRRTRTDQRRTDRQHQSTDQGRDPRRVVALSVLGLEWGASKQAIKQAHRRLVKQHHPDVGGTAEAFRRVNDAYQFLVA